MPSWILQVATTIVRRPADIVLWVMALALSPGCTPPTPPAPVVQASLTGVSPRTVSNATANPLLLFGRDLRAGLTLHVGAPWNLDLPVVVDDDAHAAAVLPVADLGSAIEASVDVQLKDATGQLVGERLTIVAVNDRHFDDLVRLALTPDGTTAVAVSPTTDKLLVVTLATGEVEAVDAGDGPAAVDIATIDGRVFAVVVQRDAPGVLLISIDKIAGVRSRRIVTGPRSAGAVLVDGSVAYVGEHVDDTVVAIDLQKNAVLWRAPVDPNPVALTLVGTPRRLAVGSSLAGTIRLVDPATGAVGDELAPRAGMTILGGHTEAHSADVVGGTGIRALVGDVDGVLFVASVGPNLGPNREKDGTQVEVSGVGGIGVVGVVPEGTGRFRHLAFDWGVPQALALDRARQRLYIADVAEGLVHVVDTNALAHGKAVAARQAKLGEIVLPLPDSWPLIRPREDFAIKGRAGVEVHTGPQALGLSADGKTLWVLERFTGRLTRVDVSTTTPRVLSSIRLIDALQQQERRLGQVLYFTDVGRRGMSCDSCHIEGHAGGVFFTKTGMMRIWRSPTVRGTRDTPPYFNPPAHRTLAETVRFVGGRNRYQNPSLTDDEVQWLTTYTQTFVTPPNPFRRPDGGLPEAIDVGGTTGDPRRGRAVFNVRCASCHPAPLFSTDQDKATRVQFSHTDTPAALPIRLDQQDTSFAARTPPSLVGAWDVWPMFLSGAAGFGVDGQALVVADHDALQAVVDRYLTPKHGGATLTPTDRAALLAYLKCL